MTKRLSSTYTRGFTIIELLVVVVVIGVLASITIVSYNGITGRANTASAQAAAKSVIQKAEIYNVELGTYPDSPSDLTADPSTIYYLPSTIEFDLGSTIPDSPATVRLVKCGTTPNSSQSDIVEGTNLTGLRVHYWTYGDEAEDDAYFSAGIDSGDGVACPAT